MCGPPVCNMRDSGIGDFVAEVYTDEQSIQTVNNNTDSSTQSDVLTVCDQSTLYGCSFSDMTSTQTQCRPLTSDFMCGEGIADVLTHDKATSKIVAYNDFSVNTTPVVTAETAVSCDLKNETQTCGVGDSRIDDVLCDKCRIPKHDVGVGSYTDNAVCCVDDKLCGCTKPTTRDVGVGEHDVDSRDPCTKCDTTHVADVGVGDSRVDETERCGACDFRCDYNNFASIGVGDGDVNVEPDCTKCAENRQSDTFNFDLNILNNNNNNNNTRPLTPQQQQAALCHYCGNKVDLNDTNLDESLQQMRDNMKSMKCGIRRYVVNITVHAFLYKKVEIRLINIKLSKFINKIFLTTFIVFLNFFF